MSDILIYKAEREAGLEEKIKSSASIAYSSLVSHDDEIAQQIFRPQLEELSKAAKNDTDLFPVHSILVSTVWNKNDDIFNKEEVWSARNTPQFKPTNLNHDEKQIVGTIVGNWPVDISYKLIDENSAIDDVPNLFHILVASVIFRQFSDPELKDRAESLIESIKANEKFVSMECIFHGFDYGVLTPNGESHVIARNEETAFLTSHLRTYGGTGNYQDHKVGRVLKNIVFSAKGFVDNPANPDSIIFTPEHEFDFVNASVSKKWVFSKAGVTKVDKVNNSQEIIMSDVLNNRIDELKKDLDAALAANKDLSNQLSKVNVERFETDIAQLKDRIQILEGEVQAKEIELSEAQEKVSTLSTDLETSEAEMKKSKEEMWKMKQEEKKAKRKASLVEAGLSPDEAEAKIEVFADLNDDQFAVVAETFKNNKPVAEAEAEVESEEESEETEAGEEVLETAEASDDVNLSIETDDEQDSLEEARASLASYFGEMLFGHKSSEGE